MFMTTAYIVKASLGPHNQVQQLIGRLETSSFIEQVELLERIATVREKVWAPGDTYLVAGEDQVFDIEIGTLVHRYESKWTPE
jgi:hypothetical protein